MDEATLTRVREDLTSDRAAQMVVLDEHGADPYSDEVKELGVSSSGFSDAGAQAEARADVLRAIETARTRVRQIDRALEQMDDGTYGTCIDCGEHIPEARLEVRPLSVRCVECAARHEDR